MSRFRFRVWDKGKKEYCDRNFFMTPNGELGFLIKDSSPHWRIFQNTDWCIIEQCTGLKDKNGTLIYEGDVIKTVFPDGSISLRKIVYFDEETRFFLSPYPTKEYPIYWECKKETVCFFEIIGNIHEMEKENEDDK